MKTIDIKTTQNVAIEYELASLRERILAFLLDLLIYGLGYLLLVTLVIGQILRGLAGGGMLFTLFYQLMPIIGFMLYHFISEVAANGQSWGKKSLGIRVVRLDGKEPGLSDYLLRAVFHIADTLLSLGALSALLISSSDKNQRLGDMTANTTVIRVRHNLRFHLADILNISSLDNYEPKYPQVEQLSEADMLLIKNVVNRFRNHPNAAHQRAVSDLVQRLQDVLQIQEPPRDRIEFLRTLIRDYIVITR